MVRPAMATLEVEHTFNCSEATFWDRIFLDPEYNERLFKTELKFPVCREVSREERGGQLHRVVEVVPYVGELPATLKAVIGEGIANLLVEEGLIPDPPLYQLCLGIPWGAPADTNAMKAMLATNESKARSLSPGREGVQSAFKTSRWSFDGPTSLPSTPRSVSV